MLGMIELLLHWLASLVKSRRRLEAESLVLRHQVNIPRRRASRRLWLSNADRLAFVGLYRLCPSVVDAVAIIRPETVIRWHRQGFRAFWRWMSGSRGGRPAIPKEIRDLIREMSRANWLWARLGSMASCSSSVSRSPNRPSPSSWSNAPDDRVRVGRLPAQPCSGDSRHGPVRRAHDRLQTALLSGVSRSRPKAARSTRRNGAPNGRMGCSTDDRSIPVGHSAKIPGARS
jgi:hypothetical protein